MKFCPTCETRYDEEILRFCTKDGTPLVDENQPNFTEMPSESFETPEEDLGEETMVRYKPPKDLLDPEPQPDIDRSEAPRIVISTSEEKKEQNVRSRQIPPYQPLPQKSSTGKVVLLTILGTFAALAVGIGLFVFLRNDEPTNKNLNVNTNPPNVNLNTNLNSGGSNFNITPITNSNGNTSFNVNLSTTNINANLKTPTPTPKPSPSVNINANTNITNVIINGAPPPSPKPSITATPKPPTPTPIATPKVSPTADRSSPPPNNSREKD
jgi:hypothetical protein